MKIFYRIHKYINAELLLSAFFVAATFVTFMPQAGSNVEAAREFIFPIIGPSSYTNDYYAPRSDGIHAATDIIAPKGAKLVAMADGVINWVANPEPSWGWSFSYTDDYGYKYLYIHVNNDTPGTDDGKGGPMNAYAPDLHPGNRIVAGQLLGYNGDSGNAENTTAHLHLEIEKPNGDPKNPYRILINAQKISKPVPGPVLANELLPFGTAKRNIDIEAGNFDLDPESELVTAVNSNGISNIKIYDNDETLLSSFNAYKSYYRGGINIGTGDLDNDGIDEIVVGRNGNGRVRTFELDGTMISDFFAYSLFFRGDTRVAAGDTDGDGTDEIITAVGNNGLPKVKIFEPDGTETASWLAYNSSHRNGMFVASGDLDGDLTDELVVSAGEGSWPNVQLFEPDGTKTQSWYAYYVKNKGGVRVSVGDVDPANPGPEILTSLANDGHPKIKMWSSTGSFMRDNNFIESWWRGGNDVAAGYDYAWGATFGNRRGSIRYGID